MPFVAGSCWLKLCLFPIVSSPVFESPPLISEDDRLREVVVDGQEDRALSIEEWVGFKGAGLIWSCDGRFREGEAGLCSITARPSMTCAS